MKKFILLLFVLSGCAVLTPLQKSKLIGLYHLIEIANYEEAKKAVEEMVEDPEASQWARTWYARGLLAQTAYREGIEKNDKKKSELYPDQLYVAYTSFERARILDRRGRLERQMAPRYVLLANDFQKLGESHFKANRYEEALRAFEQAIRITQNRILPVRVNKDLLYNAALAAYESKDRDKTISHLTPLHAEAFSVNASHLLFTACLEKGDTISAEKVLLEGIEKYDEDENLIILLVDLLYKKDDTEKAIKTLENAIQERPSNPVFHYTKGLIYQKTGQYQNAVDAYEAAIRLNPDNIDSYVGIATSYYNMGVEIEENARLLTNNRRVQEEKLKSEAAFKSAVSWLDKAFEKRPENQSVNIKLLQLYRALGIADKARIIQNRIN